MVLWVIGSNPLNGSKTFFSFQPVQRPLLVPICLCDGVYKGSLYTNDTGPYGTVVMSSANMLVGTGFVSRYWLQPRAGF